MTCARAGWIAEKRRLNEERMDTLFAPTYDAEWGHINPTHRAILARFLDLCPPGCTILDAACGTGKYWPAILGSGRSVRGIDQSGEMLRRAHAKFPAIPIGKGGLQEIADEAVYAGVICIDALENVFPEDWPRVLGNVHRALTPGGHLYATVELASDDEVAAAYRAGQALGLPVVAGEWAHEGGYHYYPSRGQVECWLDGARFSILAETDGDGYWHILARRLATSSYSQQGGEQAAPTPTHG